MSHPIYSSSSSTLAFVGALVALPVAGAALLTGVMLFSGGKLSAEAPKPVAAAAEVVADAAPTGPALNYSRTSYQGQLMTDLRVGEILGEIKCGKRPVQDGMDLLNVNGVPAALLQNQTPELEEGFVRATRWC